MLLNKKTATIFSITLILSPALAMASSASQDEKSGNYNILLISLVSLMLILLFVIGMLANTMQQLTFVVRDKIRKDKQSLPGVVKSLLLLVGLSVISVASFAADAEKVVVPAVTAIGGIAIDDFYLILGVLALEFMVIFSLVIYIKMLLRAISNKPELVKAASAVVKKSWFWDKFNAAA